MGIQLTADDVAAALLGLPGVEDCAVVARENTGRTSELVAYIVPAGPFSPEQLNDALARLCPESCLPTSYVAVSEIPRAGAGEVDVEELTRFAVVDGDLVAAWECELRSRPDIDRVRVVIEDVPQVQDQLHLGDLLPRRHVQIPAANAERERLEDDASPQKTDPTAATAAISHGPALTVPVPPTLTAVLRAAATAAGAHGVTYIGADGSETHQTYAELIEEAERLLGGLRHHGLQPGARVLLQLPENRDFIPAFWACVLGGFVPVPLAVPPTYREPNAAVSKLHNAWRMFDGPTILASQALAQESNDLRATLREPGISFQDIEQLRRHPRDGRWHAGARTEVALLLLTSGSTGTPKAVQLTHENILGNSAGIAQTLGFSGADRLLNWFPLDHVGGIVMFHVQAVYLACAQIHVQTDAVLRQPVLWLDLAERYRATATWAPNFAYGLITDREAEVNARPRDLSSLRVALNGGEAIVAETATRFLKLLAPHRLPASAMYPTWGMSETSSGVTISDRFAIGVYPPSTSFVEVGPPIAGVSLRIVDAEDRVVAEGAIGRLQVNGTPVTRGYSDNPELNAESFTADGWFRTGDLGVLRDGHLTLTGRSKDVIIINGANFYSHEIEAVVEDVAGVERSYTAACAVRTEGSDTDRLCVFFHPTPQDWSARLDVIRSVRDALVERAGVNPDYILPVEKSAVPKTAIGKIQRSQLRSQFEAGDFDDLTKQVDMRLGSGRTIPDWFFRKTWASRQLGAIDARIAEGRYLVFADRRGVADRTRQGLGRIASEWITVEPGGTFAQLAPDRFRINPAERREYAQLMSCLHTQGITIDHVLHLWNYAEYAELTGRPEAIAAAQYQGTYSLLHLIQTLPQVQAARTRLFFVSTYAHVISPGDALAPEKTTAAGLLRTIALESPEVDCCHLDLQGEDAGDDARWLLDELRAARCAPEVAYRDHQRMEAYLSRIDMVREAAGELPIKAGALYLLTGGLGGIGTHLAQVLIRQHQAKVLLVGTTVLPDGTSAEAQDGDRITKRLRNFRAIQGAGRDDVLYRPVDLSDSSALRAAVSEAESLWDQPLAGVFHLAGSLGSAPTLEGYAAIADRHRVSAETVEGFEALFRAKVYGTAALFELLADRPETLFVAFSSINALFGGTALGAYAAANSFLDAFCGMKRERSHPQTYSFNWTMWDEMGISERAPAHARETSRHLGYHILSRNQGLQSMLAALCRTPGQIIVGLDSSSRHIRRHVRAGCSPMQRVSAYYTAKAGTPAASAPDFRHLRVPDRFGGMSHCESVEVEASVWHDDGGIERAVASHSRSGPERVAPRTDLEEQIARLWRETLGIADIGVRDRFFDLGGDSLLAMRLGNRLRETFGFPITLRNLFEAPTIEGLAALVGTYAAHPIAKTKPTDEETVAFRDDRIDIASLTDEEVDILLKQLSSAGVAREAL